MGTTVLAIDMNFLQKTGLGKLVIADGLEYMEPAIPAVHKPIVGCSDRWVIKVLDTVAGKCTTTTAYVQRKFFKTGTPVSKHIGNAVDRTFEKSGNYICNSS